MNKNEKIVLNNLLDRIDESSYPELEKMFNTYFVFLHVPYKGLRT